MISVLIVCHNEVERLPHLWRSLLAQTARDLIHEVLVADNNSHDGSYEWWQRAQESGPMNIRLFKMPSNNLGAARAHLVRECATERMLFIDADCVAPQSWLRDMLKNWDRQVGNCAGICAPNRLPETCWWKSALNRMMSSALGHGFSAQAWKPQRPEIVDHLPTTNALMSRSAVLNVGNFSTHIQRTGEDFELGQRFQQSGYEMWLCPSPVVTNDCAPTIKKWSERMFRFGRSRQKLTPASALFNLALLPFSILGLVLLPLLALLFSFIIGPRSALMMGLTHMSYLAGMNVEFMSGLYDRYRNAFAFRSSSRLSPADRHF